MALANDNFYGYVQKLLVQEHVTWLECAAASLCWSTILVYYLEDPHGHLMLESMQGAQARTEVRGNLFSFILPWEDIEQRCREATGYAVATNRRATRRTDLRSDNNMGLPHDESLLATLVHVHIVGGQSDLSKHLQGATLRPVVVEALIAGLRESGYPGYNNELNSPEQVKARMEDQYRKQYGEGPFVPARVQAAIEEACQQKLGGASLIQEKNATPAEPVASVREVEESLRPLQIVAERSGTSASGIHDEYSDVLSRFAGTLEMRTGSIMMSQFVPQYIGMAFAFTQPAAVGGYDLPGQDRWRRPSAETIEAENSAEDQQMHCPHWDALQDHTAAARVDLHDFVKGMAQRVEGQYRRHWSYIPALWNLYFRERLYLGASLQAVTQGGSSTPLEHVEQDAAKAAADLYAKLQNGTYISEGGKRRKIDGDVAKLMFAEGITQEQKRLLADFRFRTGRLAGTQEIRVKIGHIGFWASIVFGNGTFMTISPGERHNYLAIRLSRYRGTRCILVQCSSDREL